MLFLASSFLQFAFPYLSSLCIVSFASSISTSTFFPSTFFNRGSLASSLLPTNAPAVLTAPTRPSAPGFVGLLIHLPFQPDIIMHKYSRNSVSVAGTASGTPLPPRRCHHEAVCSRHFTPLHAVALRISSTPQHLPPQRHIPTLVPAVSKSCCRVPAWRGRLVGRLGDWRDACYKLFIRLRK